MVTSGDLTNQIAGLHDDSAITILKTVTEELQQNEQLETEMTTELRQILQAEFQIGEPSKSVSNGDAARASLQLLAHDADFSQRIGELISRAPARDLGLVSTAAIITMTLVVLQTHVRIEKDKDDKISWKVEKKASDNKLLELLVNKLLSFKPSRLFGG